MSLPDIDPLSVCLMEAALCQEHLDSDMSAQDKLGAQIGQLDWISEGWRVNKEALLMAEVGRLLNENRQLKAQVTSLQGELNRAEGQRRKLKSEVRVMQTEAHFKNKALDAMRWVWDDTGQPRGVCRYSGDDITREQVKMAVRNTDRLIRWWNRMCWRVGAQGDQIERMLAE